MPARNSLIIFIKTPEPGHIKTRLARDINEDYVRALYTAFLKDLDYRFNNQKEYQTWYAIAPENFNFTTLSGIIRLNKYFLQHGAHLGSRMHHAFGHVSQDGSDKMVLIGSDIPAISGNIIAQAFSKLDQSECVLGPTTDGGYYLIGLKKPQPALFADISWSTEMVLQQTLERAGQENIPVDLLARLNDVDTLSDLRKLHQLLLDQNRSISDFPKFTWNILEKMNHFL